jgi:hypothetical protein
MVCGVIFDVYVRRLFFMELITDDELRNKVHELVTDKNLIDKELMEEVIMIYREYLNLLDE